MCSLSVGPSCHEAETDKKESTAARWVTIQHHNMSNVTECLKILTGNHWNSDVPTPAVVAYCTKLQIIFCGHHTFPISSHTVTLRVHHDIRTHCNMQRTNEGQTILNIPILDFPHTIVSWNACLTSLHCSFVS